jgi:Ca2+-binding RTX toxin-like protein
MANVTGTDLGDVIGVGFASGGVDPETGATNQDDNIAALAGADFVDSGGGADDVSGGEGNDTLRTGDGADFVSGGLGSDTIDAGAGADTIFSENDSDDDTVTGGAGSDTFIFAGNHADDTITDFEDGVDLIDLTNYEVTDISDLTIRQDGPNTVIEDYNIQSSIALENFQSSNLSNDDFIFRLISGTEGDDTITAEIISDGVTGGKPSDEADRIEALGGNDFVSGAGGEDDVDAGAGNDTIFSGNDSDDDRLTGGAGNDVFVFAGVNADDTITDFEDGVDRIDLRNYDVNDISDLTIRQDGANTVIEGYSGLSSITLENFERTNLSDDDFVFSTITGTEGADIISDDIVSEGVTGGRPTAGDDNIEALGGDDFVNGGVGEDRIDAGDGEDTLFSGNDSNDDLLTGGAGADVFAFSGPNGNDTITDFTDASDTIDLSNYAAGDIEDLDITQDGDNTVISGYSEDGNSITLENFDSDNLSNEDFDFGGIVGTEIADIISVGFVSDGVTGGQPSDEADTINALGGNDSVNSGGGDDRVRAGNGADTVAAGDGADFVDGGNGADVIDAGAGADTILSGADDADDTLTGGGDSDVFTFVGLHGDDTITDFEDGLDLIDFRDYEVNDISDFDIRDDDGDTVIADYDGLSTVRLENFDSANVDDDDFIFRTITGTENADTITPDDTSEGVNGLPPSDRNDTINALGGADTVDGGGGRDEVDAGAGDDTVLSGDDSDNDTLKGGPGADVFTFEGNNGDDTITDFEDGVDLIDFQAYEVGDIEDFDIRPDGDHTVIADYDGLSTVTLENFDPANLSNDDFIFQVITGTGNADTILPGFVSEGVTGGEPSEANDTIEALGGNDIVDGGDGQDRVDAGAGVDTIVSGADNNEDTLTGGGDADVFVFVGENGEDTITDFTDGSDLIDMRNYGVDDIDDLNVQDVDGDTHISGYSGLNDEITLEDFDVANLDNDDFLFG